MLVWAIVILFLAAFFGFYILMSVLKNIPTPKLAVFTHGPLALTGLILVIIYAAMGHADPLIITSIVLFLISGLGGFILFSLDMSKRPLPKSLAILHLSINAIALLLLIIYAVR